MESVIATSQVAAAIFVICCGVAVLFQLALALGAPWGHLAMGGRFPGRLPAPMRIVAVAQAALMVTMAIVVSSRAGLGGLTPFPGWIFWGVVTLSFASMVMNWVTPSLPERKLWGPVTTVMFLCCFAVAFFP